MTLTPFLPWVWYRRRRQISWVAQPLADVLRVNTTQGLAFAVVMSTAIPYFEPSLLLFVCVLTAIAYPIARLVWFRFGRVAEEKVAEEKVSGTF